MNWLVYIAVVFLAASMASSADDKPKPPPTLPPELKALEKDLRVSVRIGYSVQDSIQFNNTDVLFLSVSGEVQNLGEHPLRVDGTGLLVQFTSARSIRAR